MSPADDTVPADLSAVVSGTSTPGQITDHILSSIAVGALPVGTRLPAERDLAEALAVSRSSVRQALATLERAGFVDRRRGRGGGTFIAAVDAVRVGDYADRLADFRRARHDLLDARAILQNRIAATAADRRSAADVGTLVRAAAAYAEAETAADARTADARFHHAIALATGNPHLVAVMLDLDRQINAGFRHDPFSPELFARACTDHAGIVRAIGEQDAEAAGHRCEAHFRGTTMGGA